MDFINGIMKILQKAFISSIFKTTNGLMSQKEQKINNLIILRYFSLL